MTDNKPTCKTDGGSLSRWEWVPLLLAVRKADRSISDVEALMAWNWAARSPMSSHPILGKCKNERARLMKKEISKKETTEMRPRAKISRIY